MAAVAFLAGLFSFFSPCVLPLIPVYLAYLAGTQVKELQTSSRWLVLSNAACFIFGFSLVFIALGASASALGSALLDHRMLLERVGGFVMMLLGLWILGALKIPVLYREARFHFQVKPAGFLGSALVGAAFAAGWTPCVGPVLSGILLLASRSGSISSGIGLLAVYSLGFALPLLLCALALEESFALLKRIHPALPFIERAIGAFLLVLGFLLAGGWYARLSTAVLSYFPG